MKQILWGYILVFFHFAINGFDILPDCLGYLLLFLGAGKLEETHFQKMKPFALFMSISSLLFTAGQLAGMSFVGALFTLYNLFGVGVWIVINYLTVFGIKDLECSTGRQLGAQKLWTIWKIQTGLQVAVRLLMFLFVLSPTLALVASILTAIFTILLIVVDVIFLVYFSTAKTKYERRNEQNPDENPVEM